ncbi:MAG: hypothetical protein QXQ70_05020 [Candidatus Caldarchaeum sp.]
MVTFMDVLAASIVAGIASAIFLPLSKLVSRKTGCMGMDVHKTPAYPVPKLGGLSIMAGTYAGLGFLSLALNQTTLVAAFYSSTLVAGLIGLFEDFRELNPVLKPLLLTAAGIPVLLTGVYTPNPVLPFVGTTRLTIIYPLLVFAGFAVVCNAVNSIDVLNGSMGYTSLAVLIPLSLVSFLEGRLEILAICIILAVSLAVFLTQNSFPAKVFAGNVGSLYVGAALTFIAITGRIEVVTIVALMPQIMNEFHIIYSLRGFKSAKTSSARPVVIYSGMIKASVEANAPITLLRMLAADRGVTERQAVARLTLLSLYSALLSVITYFLFIGGV